MARVVTTNAVSLLGVHGALVTVEAHVCNGLPTINLVGLPDASLREAKDRVRAAVSSCGYTLGSRRVTVNLSPADLPKTGSGFDLAIAVAMLWAEQNFPKNELKNWAFFGELGLDGQIHPVKGTLPVVATLAKYGIKKVAIAPQSIAQARLIPGIEAHAFSHLSALIRTLGGDCSITPEKNMNTASNWQGSKSSTESYFSAEELDMTEVQGQAEGKFALEVAAAGGHHLYFVGSPGAGKTMLAKRLPTILPPLNQVESLAVSEIHSLAGTFDAQAGLLRNRPFVAPHHGASMAAIVGGGTNIAGPGLISLAHKGVLFLDEAPEFSPRVLDALRQPIENGQIVLSRAKSTITLPAQFQLVMAANPCPCGNAFALNRSCECSPFTRRRYLQRLSGPLLDRIDIQMRITAPSRIERRQRYQGDTSKTIQQRVIAARQKAKVRIGDGPWETNSQVTSRVIQSWSKELEAPCLRLLDQAIERGVITMRGADRIQRLAWTIADLKGMNKPEKAEILQAQELRNGSVKNDY
ncbi:hypothetical protein BK816_03905 [Boudabousia tangfeifanii]|uniref:AAA+ ATPase domain-containing protein n=1 Tax=Boudabousia tangfeifanii TaxID=1912795 RepID=A0A1D9MJR6_9ACTO|nr:YifB family Mg chelatase-like AAA ATPase [Boudabousia tangfeifanii]AOZ72547.1 hypothetical protein BK816_03905 [Boudabousia tangfeifanii]